MDTVFVVLIVLALLAGALLLAFGREELSDEPPDADVQLEALLRRQRIHHELEARLIQQDIRRRGSRLRQELRRSIDELGRR